MGRWFRTATREQREGDEEAGEELRYAEPEPEIEAPRPRGGYRVAGDAEVRSKELEQDIAQLRERYKVLEREVWAARRTIRHVHAAKIVSSGGVGATLGTLLALGLLAFDVVVEPSPLLAIVIVAYLLGAIVGMRWRYDDDFPEAPPPRLH